MTVPMTWVRTVFGSVFGAAVAAALSMVLVSTPAGAQEGPPNSDFDVEHLDLLVVDPMGKALDSGGGLTQFSVELEGEDECPGDSAHDDYRVDSYMVPLEADPTKLDFSGLGPHPPAFREYETYQYPLQKTNGSGFAAELTGQATEAGGPGPIRDIPPFDFHVFVPTPGIDNWEGGVPAGAYRIGLACTFAGRITNLWETTIEVTDDPTDEPVGMRWTVTGPQPRELETAPSKPIALIAGLVAFALLSAVAAFVLRRPSRRPSDPPPVAMREESVL